MMDMHKQDLFDQFDDAAFALMMDGYAEEEGARLLREFEESAPHEEIPESLDKKCRRMIDAEFSRKRCRKNVKKVLRFISNRAALLVLVLLAVSATVVMSVDAFREPLLKYIVEHLDYATVIQFEDPYTSTSPGGQLDDPLAALLPSRFTRCAYENNDGMLYIAYTDPEGHYATFDMTLATGAYFFDSGDGEYTEFSVNGWPAYYVKKDDRQQLLWIDTEKQIIFNFTVTGVSEDVFTTMYATLIYEIEKSNYSASASAAEYGPESYDPLRDLLPEGFERLYLDNLAGRIAVSYEDVNGHVATLQMSFPQDYDDFDTEDPAYTKQDLFGYRAFYQKTDKQTQMIWLDDEKKIVYSFRVTGISESEFQNMCNQLIPRMNHYHEMALAYAKSPANQFPNDPLAGLLPEGYYPSLYNNLDDELYYYIYHNEDGARVSFDANPADGEYRSNNNGVTQVEFQLLDHDAFLNYGDVVEIIWISEPDMKIYSLYATDLPKEEVLAIAEKLAAKLPLPPYEISEENTEGFPMVSAE